MPTTLRLAALGLLAALTLRPVVADDPPQGPPYRSAADLLEAHDRRLIRDLVNYLAQNAKAEDRDLAHTTLFETVIKRDWFQEHEAIARTYLAENPDGSVRSMARIVATMAKAQGGKFADALVEFKDLMKGLGGDEQLEFASEFADSLASAASVAGEYDLARRVYEELLAKFGTNAELRAKVQGDLDRIAMVGKPAPIVAVRDWAGVTFRLSDYKGKYVLVDFWATWCEPCLDELPNVQKAYNRYHAKGFEVLSVSLDETTAPIRDFLKTHEMPWRQVHNPSCGGDVMDAFGVNSIPATFLIGPDGTVLRLELRGAALEKALAELIKAD